MSQANLEILVKWSDKQWLQLSELIDILNGESGYEMDDQFSPEELIEAMLYLISRKWSRLEIALRWGRDHSPHVPRVLRTRPEDESVQTLFMELYSKLRDDVSFCPVSLRLDERIIGTDFLRLVPAYPLGPLKDAV